MQTIRCPYCNSLMRVADEAVGKMARCGKCKKVFRIEVPAQAEDVEVEQKTEEAAPAPAEPVKQRREKPSESADRPRRKKKKKPRVYVEVLYPAWLGILSCAWALVGWALAALAPHLAFVPLVGVLHFALPVVTVALIGANLYLAVRNLWRGAHPLALLLVTGLQMGLFTTLFFQLFAHLGAGLYDVHGPTSTWQWLGFSLAHALRAWDVLDVIEAYSLNVQMIRHDGWLVAVFVILYHVVVDIFFLGVVWDVVERIKEQFLDDEVTADFVRKALKAAFALWFVAWMVTFVVHRWAPIDVPLWFVENILRVLDFADIMESFDLSLHGLPREGLTGTLTFFCRLWIVIGIGLVLGRKKQAAERRIATPPGAGALAYWSARAGILAAGLLVVLGTGLLWQVVLADPVPGLAGAAGGESEGRATAALAVLRRMGPTAQAAVPALTAARKTAAEKTRDDITRTLGYLGTEAVDPLVDIVLGEGEASAGFAVNSLGRIRPDGAPALAKVWIATSSEAVREQAAAELQRFGSAAVPPLMAATTPENAEAHYHWFIELDRNWMLRSTPNKVAKALQKLPAMLKELKKDPDAAATVKILDGLKDCGSGARTALPAAIDRLGARDPKVQGAAAALVASLAAASGPAATPELLRRLNFAAPKLDGPLFRILTAEGMWNEAVLKDPMAIPALTQMVYHQGTPGDTWMTAVHVLGLGAAIEMAIRDEMKSKSVVIMSFNWNIRGFASTATAQNGEVFDITNSRDGGEWQWQAKPRYRDEGSHAGEERDDNALKLKLCWCPTQWSVPRPPGHPPTNAGGPGFWIGKYEVTQSEWAGLMGSLPSRALDKGKGDRHPVYYVSYDDATEFCRKLTDRERNAGRLPWASAYRLPTEEQWVYACSAATAFGNQLGSTEANFNGDWPCDGAKKGPNLGKTVAVGSYRPNAWGIYDLYGNVSEFTLKRGVIRGGSWYDSCSICLSGIHFTPVPPNAAPPNTYEGSQGFRVARVPSYELLKGMCPKSMEQPPKKPAGK